MNTSTSRSNRRPSNHRRSRGQRPSTGQRLVTVKQISGSKFTPPSNPPDVTYQPWIPLTLIISHTTALAFKVSSLLPYIRKQVDPTNRGFNQADKGEDAFTLQFRLLSIMAWNLSGRVISLSVDDFTDSNANAGGRDQLCGLVDTGTSIHTPAVGYTLPMSAQQHVLRTDSKQNDMFLFDVSGNSGQFITYVKILYRFDGPIHHPSIVSPIQEVERTLTKISNKIIKQKEPSTLELMWNGVKYTAEAVAIVGAVGSDPTSKCQCGKTCDSLFDLEHITALRDSIDLGVDSLVHPLNHAHLDSPSSSFADVDEEPSMQALRPRH